MMDDSVESHPPRIMGIGACLSTSIHLSEPLIVCRIRTYEILAFLNLSSSTRDSEGTNARWVKLQHNNLTNRHLFCPLQTMSIKITCLDHVHGQFHENGPQNTKKLNLCNKYVTGVTRKLIICSFLCKKNDMIIYIRINFVNILNTGTNVTPQDVILTQDVIIAARCNTIYARCNNYAKCNNFYAICNKN